MTTTTTGSSLTSNGKSGGTSTVDAAAKASIGAAARELHLPTVRTEATRLADIALRERQTHLGYLAEVLAAEVDDRTARRRARRIADATAIGRLTDPTCTASRSPARDGIPRPRPSASPDASSAPGR